MEPQIVSKILRVFRNILLYKERWVAWRIFLFLKSQNVGGFQGIFSAIMTHLVPFSSAPKSCWKSSGFWTDRANYWPRIGSQLTRWLSVKTSKMLRIVERRGLSLNKSSLRVFHEVFSLDMTMHVSSKRYVWKLSPWGASGGGAMSSLGGNSQNTQFCHF